MSESESPSSDVFDIERIRRLVELMEEHDLRELDLKQSEQQIRLSRGAEIVYGQPRTAAVAPAPVALAGTAPAPAPGPRAAAEPPADEDHIVYIKSPMVGTFYLRPNPNADPYVKTGDTVAPETTVCIIEAMKVFNEIPAEVRGKIVAILVDDEEPVDHGRPLFKIDTRQG